MFDYFENRGVNGDQSGLTFFGLTALRKSGDKLSLYYCSRTNEYKIVSKVFRSRKLFLLYYQYLKIILINSQPYIHFIIWACVLLFYIVLTLEE